MNVIRRVLLCPHGRRMLCRTRPKRVHEKQLSTFNFSQNQILSYSSTFIQDGVEINEVPIIVRHTDITSLSSSQPTVSLLAESKEDVEFRKRLFECETVSQVLRLLNMPADQVSAHSASYALQRLVQLHVSSQQRLSSFIQTAVLNELCDTATKHIHLVPNSTIIDLVQCALTDSFQDVYMSRICQETEKRIGDSRFTIEEICNLIHLVSGNPKPGMDVLNSLWIHLGNRAEDIDETNLPLVYSTASLVRHEHKYLLDIFLKRLSSCWWKLKSREFTQIATVSTNVVHKNFKALSLLGRWAFMNIKQVNDLDLAQMIAAYSYHHYVDKNFINALERYVAENIWNMNVDVIALAMEYLRQLRFISPRIFDVVASHFEQLSTSYNAPQLLLVLRTFGQLNYEPPNVGRVFDKLEDVLLQRFDDFTPVSFVDLLSSFVYLRRLPLNFINKVFSSHFLSQVNAVTEPAIKARVSRQLKQIQCAVKLEMQYCHLPYLFMDAGDHYLWLDAQQYTVSQELVLILQGLLGQDQFSTMVTIPKTPYHADFEIGVDALGNVSPTSSNKVVLTILMPEFFCTSHHHLLGEFVMRQRHLQLLGYKVVQILYKDYIQCPDFIQKSNYVASLLRPYVKNVEVYWDA